MSGTTTRELQVLAQFKDMGVTAGLNAMKDAAGPSGAAGGAKGLGGALDMLGISAGRTGPNLSSVASSMNIAGVAATALAAHTAVVGHTMQGMADVTGKVVTTGLNLATGAIKGATTVLGGLTSAIAGLTISMAKSDSIAHSYSDSMRKLGADGDALLKSMRASSEGLVRDTEIMQKVNSATMLIGKETLEKAGGATTIFARMLRASMASARATGYDVEFMFNSIVMGVGRASPLILDNLGLSLRLGDVYERAAASLGKKANALTAVEKKTALLNEVLKQGEAFAEQFGISTGGVNTQLQKVNASLQNFLFRTAQAFVPVVNPILKNIAVLAESINFLNEPLNALGGLLGKLPSWFTSFAGMALSASFATATLGGTVNQLLGGMGGLGTMLQRVAPLAGIAAAALTALAGAYRENMGGMKDKVDAFAFGLKGAPSREMVANPDRMLYEQLKRRKTVDGVEGLEQGRREFEWDARDQAAHGNTEKSEKAAKSAKMIAGWQKGGAIPDEKVLNKAAVAFDKLTEAQKGYMSLGERFASGVDIANRALKELSVYANEAVKALGRGEFGEALTIAGAGVGTFAQRVDEAISRAFGTDWKERLGVWVDGLGVTISEGLDRVIETISGSGARIGETVAGWLNGLAEAIANPEQFTGMISEGWSSLPVKLGLMLFQFLLEAVDFAIAAVPALWNVIRAVGDQVVTFLENALGEAQGNAQLGASVQRIFLAIGAEVLKQIGWLMGIFQRLTAVVGQAIIGALPAIIGIVGWLIGSLFGLIVGQLMVVGQNLGLAFQEMWLRVAEHEKSTNPLRILFEVIRQLLWEGMKGLFELFKAAIGGIVIGVYQAMDATIGQVSPSMHAKLQGMLTILGANTAPIAAQSGAQIGQAFAGSFFEQLQFAAMMMPTTLEGFKNLPSYLTKGGGVAGAGAAAFAPNYNMQAPLGSRPNFDQPTEEPGAEGDGKGGKKAKEGKEGGAEKDPVQAAYQAVSQVAQAISAGIDAMKKIWSEFRGLPPDQMMDQVFEALGDFVDRAVDMAGGINPESAEIAQAWASTASATFGAIGSAIETSQNLLRWRVPDPARLEQVFSFVEQASEWAAKLAGSIAKSTSGITGGVTGTELEGMIGGLTVTKTAMETVGSMLDVLAKVDEASAGIARLRPVKEWGRVEEMVGGILGVAFGALSQVEVKARGMGGGTKAGGSVQAVMVGLQQDTKSLAEGIAGWADMLGGLAESTGKMARARWPSDLAAPTKMLEQVIDMAVDTTIGLLTRLGSGFWNLLDDSALAIESLAPWLESVGTLADAAGKLSAVRWGSTSADAPLRMVEQVFDFAVGIARRMQNDLGADFFLVLEDAKSVNESLAPWLESLGKVGEAAQKAADGPQGTNLAPLLSQARAALGGLVELARDARKAGGDGLFLVLEDGAAIAAALGGWADVLTKIGGVAGVAASVNAILSRQGNALDMGGVSKFLGEIGKVAGAMTAGARGMVGDDLRFVAQDNKDVADALESWLGTLSGLAAAAASVETVNWRAGWMGLEQAFNFMNDIGTRAWAMYTQAKKSLGDRAKAIWDESRAMADTFAAWIDMIGNIDDAVESITRAAGMGGRVAVGPVLDWAFGVLREVALKGWELQKGLMRQIDPAGTLAVSTAMANTFAAWVEVFDSLADLARALRRGQITSITREQIAAGFGVLIDISHVAWQLLQPVQSGAQPGAQIALAGQLAGALGSWVGVFATLADLSRALRGITPLPDGAKVTVKAILTQVQEIMVEFSSGFSAGNADPEDDLKIASDWVSAVSGMVGLLSDLGDMGRNLMRSVEPSAGEWLAAQRVIRRVWASVSVMVAQYMPELVEDAEELSARTKAFLDAAGTAVGLFAAAGQLRLDQMVEPTATEFGLLSITIRRIWAVVKTMVTDFMPDLVVDAEELRDKIAAFTDAAGGAISLLADAAGAWVARVDVAEIAQDTLAVLGRNIAAIFKMISGMASGELYGLRDPETYMDRMRSFADMLGGMIEPVSRIAELMTSLTGQAAPHVPEGWAGAFRSGIRQVMALYAEFVGEDPTVPFKGGGATPNKGAEPDPDGGSGMEPMIGGVPVPSPGQKRAGRSAVWARIMEFAGMLGALIEPLASLSDLLIAVSTGSARITPMAEAARAALGVAMKQVVGIFEGVATDIGWWEAERRAALESLAVAAGTLSDIISPLSDIMDVVDRIFEFSTEEIEVAGGGADNQGPGGQGGNGDRSGKVVKRVPRAIIIAESTILSIKEHALRLARLAATIVDELKVELKEEWRAILNEKAEVMVQLGGIMSAIGEILGPITSILSGENPLFIHKSGSSWMQGVRWNRIWGEGGIGDKMVSSFREMLSRLIGVMTEQLANVDPTLVGRAADLGAAVSAILAAATGLMNFEGLTAEKVELYRVSVETLASVKVSVSEELVTQSAWLLSAVQKWAEALTIVAKTDVNGVDEFASAIERLQELVCSGGGGGAGRGSGTGDPGGGKKTRPGERPPTEGSDINLTNNIVFGPGEVKVMSKKIWKNYSGKGGYVF